MIVCYIINIYGSAANKKLHDGLQNSSKYLIDINSVNNSLRVMYT